MVLATTSRHFAHQTYNTSDTLLQARYYGADISRISSGGDYVEERERLKAIQAAGCSVDQINLLVSLEDKKTVPVSR